MGLDKIAERLDAALNEADEHLNRQQKEIAEADAKRMSHYILRHVLERAPVGTDPYSMGQALVQGATIGEDESGGELVAPVVEFLEGLLEGARSVMERFGADNVVYDPVDHAVQYYLSHNRWPESASPAVIAKATATLADGLRGNDDGEATGTFL